MTVLAAFIWLAVVVVYVTVIGWLTGALIVRSRRHPKHSFKGLPEPLSISIVIPTYDEESIISRKIENVLNQDYPHDKMEIILVDCSTDNTLVNALRYADEVKLVILKQERRTGVADALNVGYSAANGKVIMKTDCDAFTQDLYAIRKLISHFSASDVGAVSCTYLESKDNSEQNFLYRQSLTKLQEFESALDSSVIAHGAALLFRRELRPEIESNSEADDTEVFLKIRRQGYRCIIDAEVKFTEIRPSGRLRSIGQRSRRARGIQRVLLANRSMILNSQFGDFGRIILPLNFILLVVSPLTLAFIVATFPLILFVATNERIGLFGTLAVILVVASMIISKRPKVVSAFFESQICAFLGMLSFSFRPRLGVWRKSRSPDFL